MIYILYVSFFGKYVSCTVSYGKVRSVNYVCVNKNTQSINYKVYLILQFY